MTSHHRHNSHHRSQNLQLVYVISLSELGRQGNKAMRCETEFIGIILLLLQRHLADRPSSVSAI